MNTFAKTLLVTAAMLVAGAAYAAKDYVILELDDREIKKSDVSAIWQGLFPAGSAPDFDTVEEPIKQNVLRGVVSEYLLYDEAIANGADKDAAVLARIEDAKRKLIVRHYIEKKTNDMVTEKEMKQEYDTIVRDLRNKEEVRARHILVEKEDEAKAIKKKLDDGGDFEKLATENSKDPGSKAQGGDLGYFTEDKMVPEFGKAAFALKKGAVSDIVKTAFGYHIIKLEDRRKVEAPTYNDMQAEIKNKLVEDKLNDYVNKLVDKTNVKYFGPDGKEKELSKVPDEAGKAAN